MIEMKNVTGHESFRYIRKELSRGRSLSSFISDLPIDNGNVYAFVPKGVPEESIYAFENGGIYPFDKESLNTKHPVVPVQNDARLLLSDEIQQHLNADKKSCCLFEDPILWPSDSKLTTLGIDYVYLGSEQVLYFFNSSNVNTGKIDKAIKVSDDYIFLCALSSLDLTAQTLFLPSKEITTDSLKLFAINVFAFFVGAYDGEGYLMWIRKK